MTLGGQAMTRPSTEAGREYLAWVAEIYGVEDARMVIPNVLAIEQEARDTAPLDVEPCPDCVMEHVWPCPTIPRCDEPGCEVETSCGWPSNAGYRRTCGRHYRAALTDTEADRD